MPELTELEFNDALGTYQSMLEQHSLSVGVVGRGQGDQDHKMEEDPPAGGKLCDINNLFWINRKSQAGWSST